MASEERSTPARNHRTIAYFSMEVGLRPEMPTYSGGLGILAGDTLKAAADLEVPMVGVTLLYRQGYFRQRLDGDGNQTESPDTWAPESFLELLPETVTVSVEKRNVQVRAWRYWVEGVHGHRVPVYFLDAGSPENDEFDRTLTDALYGGDRRYRLAQEILLGVGGVKMLHARGHRDLAVHHMNEGHSSFLTLELLRMQMERRGSSKPGEAEIDAVRRHCVFTTHTPVPAGHDVFDADLVRSVLAEDYVRSLDAVQLLDEGRLNMTRVGLRFSRYINGVAMRHRQVSQDMFPAYPIDSITNGVHAQTWASEPMASLFDEHFPEWRRDALYLRHAVSVPLERIREAHLEAKRRLLNEVERRTGTRLDPEVFTLGFARRAAAYKRADLLFSDPERLQRIAREHGRLQILYAGKAHPQDEQGKGLIRRVFESAKQIAEDVPVVYLENYDMVLGKLLCSGVDLWLNTPTKPKEASGTSGMKGALNGVPSLSVLDGWWIEGHAEGATGWSLGEEPGTASDDASEAASLYEKLEQVVVPLYYGDRDAFAKVMQTAISMNGSYFSAQRMMVQYIRNAYRSAEQAQLEDLQRQP